LRSAASATPRHRLAHLPSARLRHQHRLASPPCSCLGPPAWTKGSASTAAGPSRTQAPALHTLHTAGVLAVRPGTPLGASPNGPGRRSRSMPSPGCPAGWPSPELRVVRKRTIDRTFSPHARYQPRVVPNQRGEQRTRIQTAASPPPGGNVTASQPSSLGLQRDWTPVLKVWVNRRWRKRDPASAPATVHSKGHRMLRSRISRAMWSLARLKASHLATLSGGGGSNHGALRPQGFQTVDRPLSALLQARRG